MEATVLALSALIGYLAGSVSFSRMISTLVAPNEETKEAAIPIPGTNETYTMRSQGATTVAMKLGPKIGCTIGLLDMLKVTIPVLIFRFLYPEQPYLLITAIMGVVGHNWPIFYKFKGGRGISAIYGGLLGVDWLAAILTPAIGMFIGMAIFKDFMIAYMAGLWVLIPWMWFTTYDYAYLAYAIILNILFTVAMIPDIKQSLEIRKRLDKQSDLTQMMEMTPMGKGMLKMANFFRFSKK